jgi:hypothetical protein
MQRGANMAKGKYLIFCNAGDQIFGFDFLSSAFMKLCECEAYWGFGPIIEQTQRNTFAWIFANKSATTRSIIARKDFVAFPSFMINREFFKQIGGFTESYKIAGDFELICKAALKSHPVVFSEPVALFAAGGISYLRADLAWREEMQIRREILDLNRVEKTTDLMKFQLRIIKWKLGKFLDQIENRVSRSGTSWRDRRVKAVPSKYEPYLN